MSPAGLLPSSIVKIEEVCRDKSALADKQKVLGGTFYDSLFHSTGDTFKFVGGILLAAAMGIIGTAISGAEDKTISAVLSAIQTEAVGLTFLAAATVIMGAGIAAHYMSSRMYHNSQFDQLEVNAQHTAKYLAQELQKTPPQLVVVQAQGQFENSGRADGKPWADVVAKEQPSNRTLSV